MSGGLEARRGSKKIQRNLKKPLDKPENLWYNKITKGQGQSKKPERKNYETCACKCRSCGNRGKPFQLHDGAGRGLRHDHF